MLASLFNEFHFLLDSQQWILDKQDISKERAADLQKVSEDEYQKIMIFYANSEWNIPLVGLTM